ncbi:hypothetical protein CEXT_525801 [Caerostris extrusa]|uniref:Uncharacterized protein n=1 Tax=Caerostris extrusa TaxID=172846 RepID=A0AAV4P221_CAEEX|nr:hypothetical protein CEXT_525801 [Caerostris extrusa]
MNIRNNFQPFSQTVEKFVFNLRIKQVAVQDCFWNNKRSGGPVGRGCPRTMERGRQTSKRRVRRTGKHNEIDLDSPQ